MSRSGFTSSTVRITSSNCVTSPRITGARRPTSDRDAATGFTSMQTTSSPRATSRRMSRGPMKPVPPITSTDMARLLGYASGCRVDCQAIMRQRSPDFAYTAR